MKKNYLIYNAGLLHVKVFFRKMSAFVLRTRVTFYISSTHSTAYLQFLGTVRDLPFTECSAITHPTEKRFTMLNTNLKQTSNFQELFFVTFLKYRTRNV